MKKKEFESLCAGDIVIHRRYGKASVKEILYSFGGVFGVIITPQSDAGKLALLVDSATNIPDILTSSFKSFK